MNKKHEMNEQQLDMVAGGVSGQELVDYGKKIYKVGKKIWDFLHKH